MATSNFDWNEWFDGLLWPTMNPNTELSRFGGTKDNPWGDPKDYLPLIPIIASILFPQKMSGPGMEPGPTGLSGAVQTVKTGNTTQSVKTEGSSATINHYGGVQDWKAFISGLAKVLPTVLGSIASNRKLQKVFDRYELANIRAMERAQDMTWAQYLQGRNDLKVYMNAGANAHNMYLKAMGVDPSLLTIPLEDVPFDRTRFGSSIPDYVDIEGGDGNGDGDPGPKNDIFPSDFWGKGLYKNIDKEGNPATDGINNLQDHFWGTKRDGHGGIMGAVLGGDLTINQARNLSLYMYKDWVKNMVDSGISRKEINKIFKEDLTLNNLLANLRKISGEETGDVNDNWITLSNVGDEKKTIEFKNFSLSEIDIDTDAIDHTYYDSKTGEEIPYPFRNDFRVTNGQDILNDGGGLTLEDDTIDPFVDWVRNTADLPDYSLRHLPGFEGVSKDGITHPSFEWEFLSGKWWASLPKEYTWPDGSNVFIPNLFTYELRTKGYGSQFNWQNPFGIDFGDEIPDWWDEETMGNYSDFNLRPKRNSKSNASNNFNNNLNKKNEYLNWFNGVEGAKPPPGFDIDEVRNLFDPNDDKYNSLTEAIAESRNPLTGKSGDELKEEYNTAVKNLANQGIVPEEFTSEFEAGSEDYLKELENWTTNLANQTGYEGYDPDWEEKFTKDFYEFDPNWEEKKRKEMRSYLQYPPGMGMLTEDVSIDHPVTGESRSEGMGRLLGIEANNWKGENWYQGGHFEVDPSTMELIDQNTGESVGYFYPDETGWRLTKGAPEKMDNGRWVAPDGARMNEHQGIPRWILKGQVGPPWSSMTPDPLLEGVDTYDFVPQWDPEEFEEVTGFTPQEWMSGVRAVRDPDTNMIVSWDKIPQDQLEAASKKIPPKRLGPEAQQIFEQYRQAMKNNPEARYQRNILQLSERAEAAPIAGGHGPLAWPIEENDFLSLGHQWKSKLKEQWDSFGRKDYIDGKVDIEKESISKIIDDQEQRLGDERARIQDLLNKAESGREEDIQAARNAMREFNKHKNEYDHLLNGLREKEKSRKRRMGIAEDALDDFEDEWEIFLKNKKTKFLENFSKGSGGSGDGDGAGDGPDLGDKTKDGEKKVKYFGGMTKEEYLEAISRKVPYDHIDPGEMPTFDYTGRPNRPSALGYGGTALFGHPYDYPSGRDPLGREGSPYEKRSGMLDPNGDPYFDPSEVPQAGANQVSELFWGSGHLTDGAGGVMGAVLAGNIDFEDASRIADNLMNNWEEDMQESGFSPEEIEGFKTQLNPGIDFLKNNIDNLRNFGGIELGGQYYDGFEIDKDRGRVVNGRDILQPQGFNLVEAEDNDPVDSWRRTAEGSIADPYNVRLTPRYQYMMKHGGKEVQRQLQATGHLRSTYGFNAYNRFVDKVLGDAEQETFVRRRDRAKELYQQKTDAEKEDYKRAIDMYDSDYSKWAGITAQNQKNRQQSLDRLRDIANLGATASGVASGAGSDLVNRLAQIQQSMGAVSGTKNLLGGSTGANSLQDIIAALTGSGDKKGGGGLADILKGLGL